MSNIQPLFIFGFAHSGTSLMQNILLAQGSVYRGKNETYFFDLTHHYSRKYSDLSNPSHVDAVIQYAANVMHVGYFQIFVRKTDPLNLNLLTPDEVDQVRSTLKSPTTYADIFQRTCDLLARREEKTAWVEKTPGHTFHAESILSAIQDAKAIALIRDPRDILASRKIRERRIRDRIKQGTANTQESHLQGFIEYDPFWTSLSWRSSWRAIQRAQNKHPDRLKVVYYEDLTTKPEETIRDICQFLDLKFNPAMLNMNRENVATMDKGSKVDATGIVASSSGKWRTALSRGEIAMTSRLLRTELLASEYELTKISLLDRVLGLIEYLRSVPNLLRRMFNKLRHKGFAYAIEAGRSYLKRLKI